MNQMTLGSQKQNAVNPHEQSIHLNLRPVFFCENAVQLCRPQNQQLSDTPLHISTEKAVPLCQIGL
jgi:hypothetical protein